MMKKIFVFIVFVIGIIIVLACGYFMFSNFYEKLNVAQFETEHTSNVEINGSFLSPNIVIENPLNSTKKLIFDGGEKFTYRITRYELSPDDEKLKNFIKIIFPKIGVGKNEWKKTIEIKKLEEGAFLVEEKTNSYSSTFKMDENGSAISGISDETFFPKKEYSPDELNVYANIVKGISEWPLQWTSAINKNFSWTQIVRRNIPFNTTKGFVNYGNQTENVTISYCVKDEIITKYKVVGTENIDGRECFKVYGYTVVEGDYRNCTNEFENYSQHHSDEKTMPIGRWFGNASGTLWIDKENRMLVKSIIFDDHILQVGEIYEINLE